MVIMRTKNCLSRFRNALTFSALLLVLPAVCPVQEADRFQLSPPARQAARIVGVEPQLGPQPPCGKEPIPPYPGLDDSAIVKSWSESDFGPRLETARVHRLDCGGLYEVGNHSRAISPYLGS